ncbi:hypothetical protein HDK77DRAFT_104715 [Phyllosticta capitalensis]
MRCPAARAPFARGYTGQNKATVSRGLVPALTMGKSKKTSEDRTRELLVLHPAADGGHSGARHSAFVHFDTQCSRNYVSRAYLERHNFDNKLIRPPEDISDDRTRDEIIGIIELDYWGNDTPRVSQEIFLKGKTYHSIFFVVEDIQFDLVIGRRTIQEDTFTKRNIFTTNPLDGTNQGGFTFRIDPAGEDTRKEARRVQLVKKEAQKSLQSDARQQWGPYWNECVRCGTEKCAGCGREIYQHV